MVWHPIVSVVIPAKPPEPYLEELIEHVHMELRHISHEVLVQTEEGLSNAVRCGVERSRGDIITVMDADGSHNPKYLRKMLLALFQGYEVALGSRYVDGGRANLDTLRTIISLLYTWVSKLVLRLSVKDTLTGYVCAWRRTFEKLAVASKSYKFGLELLMETPCDRVYEVPIIFEQRHRGMSKASLSQGVQSFLLVLKLLTHRKKVRVKYYREIAQTPISVEPVLLRQS